MMLDVAMYILACIGSFAIGHTVTVWILRRKKPKYKVTGNGVASTKSSDIPIKMICEPDKYTRAAIDDMNKNFAREVRKTAKMLKNSPFPPKNKDY